MTPFALFVAVGIVTLAATACWALLARETGVYLTSGLSFTGWAWLSLVGGDTALVTETGRVWMRQSTASLQFLALAMAVISLVVFSLRLMGTYPSPEEPAETTSGDR